MMLASRILELLNNSDLAARLALCRRFMFPVTHSDDELTTSMR